MGGREGRQKWSSGRRAGADLSWSKRRCLASEQRRPPLSIISCCSCANSNMLADNDDEAGGICGAACAELELPAPHSFPEWAGGWRVGQVYRAVAGPDAVPCGSHLACDEPGCCGGGWCCCCGGGTGCCWVAACEAAGPPHHPAGGGLASCSFGTGLKRLRRAVWFC